jgi:ABC-type phosphate transport system auxiliary subunit
VYDGKDQDDHEFTKEVVDLLGGFSTANQWSVDNLTKQLQKKSLLVEQLKNEIHSTEQIVRSRMNQDIEQIRANYQQQMKQLQDKLELIYQCSQTSKGMITQRDSLIE